MNIYKTTKIFFCVIWVIFIISCTRVTNDVCRINGNENYVCSNLLSVIRVPDDDMILPPLDKEYEIPVVALENNTFHFGKKLDICPPKTLY